MKIIMMLSILVNLIYFDSIVTFLLVYTVRLVNNSIFMSMFLYKADINNMESIF